ANQFLTRAESQWKQRVGMRAESGLDSCEDNKIKPTASGTSMSDSPDGSRPSSVFRYRFGSAEFDQAQFELRVAGERVDVQRKPLEILACLLTHSGEVVTKEELLDIVWEGRPTVENVIANALTKLRIALGPQNAECIVTQPRVGYRFVGPVERIAVGR